MQLTHTQIRKFQLLYRKKFSVELSDDEAKEKGMQLLEIMRCVYKPIAKKPSKETAKL